MSDNEVTLPESATFPASVKVPANQAPALASEFYEANDRGFQALVNRTKYLLKLATGVESAATLGESSGIKRIAVVANVLDLEQGGADPDNTVYLVANNNGVTPNRKFPGLYIKYSEGGLPTDGVNVIELQDDKQWVNLTYGLRNVKHGLAALDGDGKVDVGVLPGATARICGRIKFQGGSPSVDWSGSGTWSASVPPGYSDEVLRISFPTAGLSAANYLVNLASETREPESSHPPLALYLIDRTPSHFDIKIRDLRLSPAPGGNGNTLSITNSFSDQVRIHFAVILRLTRFRGHVHSARIAGGEVDVPERTKVVHG